MIHAPRNVIMVHYDAYSIIQLHEKDDTNDFTKKKSLSKFLAPSYWPQVTMEAPAAVGRTPQVEGDSDKILAAAGLEFVGRVSGHGLGSCCTHGAPMAGINPGGTPSVGKAELLPISGSITCLRSPAIGGNKLLG